MNNINNISYPEAVEKDGLHLSSRLDSLLRDHILAKESKDAKILDHLATSSEDVVVILAVINNQNVSSETLERLFNANKDKSDISAVMIKKELASKEYTPNFILSLLEKDKDSRVRAVAAQNPNTIENAIGAHQPQSVSNLKDTTQGKIHSITEGTVSKQRNEAA